MDNTLAYEAATSEFVLAIPTFASPDAIGFATSRHKDGRELQEEFTWEGLIRACMVDRCGNMIRTWRSQKGEIIECSQEVYFHGWQPEI